MECGLEPRTHEAPLAGASEAAGQGLNRCYGRRREVTVPFEVDGKTYELADRAATIMVEDLRHLRTAAHDAEASLSAANKIEDYLVGRETIPVRLTMTRPCLRRRTLTLCSSMR
jgi:hypothetical protein